MILVLKSEIWGNSLQKTGAILDDFGLGRQYLQNGWKYQ